MSAHKTQISKKNIASEQMQPAIGCEVPTIALILIAYCAIEDAPSRLRTGLGESQASGDPISGNGVRYFFHDILIACAGRTLSSNQF